MAAEKSRPPKRLSELLQERQEPFVLEVYLSERGYCSKRSASVINKRARGIARYAKVLQMLRKKLVSMNGSRLSVVKNSDIPDGKSGVVADMIRKEQEVIDGDQFFSSASSTTVYNSCSESDPEDGITYSLQRDDSLTLVINEDTLNTLNIPREDEATLDRKLQRGSVEDSKQLSPVSVLQQTSCHGASRLYHTQHDNLTKTSGSVTEDLILSASLQNLQDMAKSCPSTECLKSKRVLPRTKQLLLDFVKEMIATQEKKTLKQQQQKELLGTEELGKFICEKIKACGNESSMAQRPNCDSLSSKLVDISDFEQQKGEIGIEIADAIFKQMISEIVVDMFNKY
ncbi:hypothetical protein ACFE04_008017 [Oxalis oulophora]